MASEAQKRLLIKLAEQVKGSSLTELEIRSLVDSFDRQYGAERQRIAGAISESLRVSTAVVEKRAALDDTDRLLQDIENALKRK